MSDIEAPSDEKKSEIENLELDSQNSKKSDDENSVAESIPENKIASLASKALANLNWDDFDAPADEWSDTPSNDADVSESPQETQPKDFEDFAADLSALNMDDELPPAPPEEAAEPEEFIEHDRMISIIESLLFATEKPLSVASIYNAFDGTQVLKAQVVRALDDLQSIYAGAQRGVSLEEVNGGYQLRTKLDNADFLRRLNKARPFRLSGPALEVLSIIAYRQPLVKSELDQIRGVESGHLVRALMEKNLVQFAGKSELPGRPALYSTTKKFLDIFGLRNLTELPSLAEIDDLIPEGIGAEEEERETLSDITDGLSQSVASTYSEGEDELERITDQLTQITTSSDFFEEEKRKQREKRDRDRAQDIKEAITVGEYVEEKDQRWLARYEKEQELQAVSVEVAVTDEELNKFLGEAARGFTDDNATAAMGESDHPELVYEDEDDSFTDETLAEV